MNIVFYRYGSICEPDMIAAFRKLNLNVTEITEEITVKNLLPSRQVELVDQAVREVSPVFVFSINFFPAVAKVCHLLGVRYLSQTVDSPVLELFSEAVRYDTNRIFLFDKAQYDYFHRFCPAGTFHLPLAAAVERFDKVCAKTSKADVFADFTGDISFVGSLYSEKSPLNRLTLSERTRGFLDGVCEAAIKVYGYNLIGQALDENSIREIREQCPDFFEIRDAVSELSVQEIDRYVAANWFVGYLAAVKERERTLNLLAQHFTVDLFTASDTSGLRNVRTHGTVNSLTQMPLIFQKSRINLNMTIKPIEKGLPLRIFDILGCGGFLMTNYQEELTDLFEIGTDLEAYGSMEELLDKCAYYLSHEDERKQIAENGYEKVKKFCTYDIRAAQMLTVALQK